MNIQVAEPILPIPLSYNTQTTTQAQMQKRHVSNYLFPTSSNAITDTTANNASSVSRVQRWLLPSQYFLDSKQSYLSAIVQLTQSNPADVVYLTSNTDCWISRVTLLLNNGVLVGECRDANTLGAILKLQMEPAYQDSFGKSTLAMWNSGDRVITPQQQENISLRPMRYNFYLDTSALLNSDAFNYIPLKALAAQNSNSLQLEIEWAPVRQMVVAYNATGYGVAPAGNVSYSISSVYLCQDLLQDDEYEMKISEHIKEAPLVYNYRNVRHYNNTIPANTNTVTINISEFQQSMESIVFVFRNQAFVNNISQDSTAFMNPNLLSAQLQIGGNFYIPAQKLICGTSFNDGTSNVYIPQMAEVHQERAKVLQKMRKYVHGLAPSKYTDVTYNLNNYTLDSNDYSTFVMAFDLRLFPDDADGDSEYNQFSSGVNTKSNPQQIQLLLDMNMSLYNLAGVDGKAFQSTPAGAPLVPTPAQLTGITFTVDSYVFYRSSIVIQQNESYVIS